MADVAMLVVAASLGEFEAGLYESNWGGLGGMKHNSFVIPCVPGGWEGDLAHALEMNLAPHDSRTHAHDKPGTVQHLMLAKSLGMSKVIVVVNKMDSSCVRYSEHRFAVPPATLSLLLCLVHNSPLVRAL